MTSRRTLLAGCLPVGLLAGVTVGVSGCGFELRQTPELPFQRIALIGFAPRSDLLPELTRQLSSRVTVVDAPQQAEVVLEALTDRRERSVVASTAAGQVREVQLRVRLQFRLSTRAGQPLLPPDEIVLSRDMSYSETLALAKAEEERQLVRAMVVDISNQVIRRLAQAPAAR